MTRPHHTERPCAMAGLRSYRYTGRYGFVMIGATDDADALVQAARSVTGDVDPARLERWTGARYAPVSGLAAPAPRAAAPCPTCDGDGEVDRNDSNPHGYGPDPQLDYTAQCPDCEGSGATQEQAP